ncbi:MAG TPA: hypothetical protein DCY20_10765 [Firmicutes bacterium]|nr:hypothetical protein [Bacillota bacterium]
MGIKMMKKNLKIEKSRLATRMYVILLGMLVLFLVQVCVFQNVDIFEARSHGSFQTVQNEVMTEVVDEETPLGIKKEYRFNLDEVSSIDNYLSFYVVHQYVEVFIDGELIYRLNVRDGNKIGKTTASNWIIIPLNAQDKGKEVCINVIPIYEAVRDREVDFNMSSKFMIYFNQLKSDLPQILLSLVAMTIGVVFVVISSVHRYKGKESVDLCYLGIFSFGIGLWKITDIRFSPLMFTKNTAALSYISISMILISTIPWILSIKKQLIIKSYHLIEWLSIISSCTAMIILLLQIMNIADLRETLLLIHLDIAFIILMIVLAVAYEARYNKANKKIKIINICLMICAAGAIMDMFIYYIQENSSGILFTLIAFLIYITTMGYLSIYEMNHKANIDGHTNLFNKGRCHEILDENEVIQGEVGVIMFDLNRLKYVNDTFGHEQGDLLISEFANILKRNMSGRDFLGRYGGDEFMAFIKDVNEYQIQQLLEDIDQDIRQFNSQNITFSISYASGYSLSEEYPGLSLRELLKKADIEMYSNKEESREVNG